MSYMYMDVVFCVTLVDYRVQPLVMLVKKWAKKHDINDASCGTLSSYALTLMVLHYLQGEIVTKCCPVFFNVHVIIVIDHFCKQNGKLLFIIWRRVFYWELNHS